jgi:FtsH-binding integral membrane protein
LSVLALVCSRKLAKKVPINYLLLALFTLTEGFIVGLVCAATDPNIVLMAAASTLGNKSIYN